MPSQVDSQVKRTVAANIDRGIRARDMNNRQLGDAMGTTEHQVWRWRKGRVMPSPDNLAAIAQVLFGGDMSELYAPVEEAA